MTIHQDKDLDTKATIAFKIWGEKDRMFPWILLVSWFLVLVSSHIPPNEWMLFHIKPEGYYDVGTDYLGKYRSVFPPVRLDFSCFV